MATLVLAGPRISELCLLDGRHVDLAHRQIHLPRPKTDASERTVPMVPALHEILLGHRAEYGWGPDDPVFATRNGTRNTPDNLRRRILAGVHGHANELLEGRDQEAIGQLTPHVLRRTFASVLAEVGVSPRRAMYLLGHADPKLTMRVYQQVLDMGGGAVDRLETVFGCGLEEAFATLSGREVLGLNKDPLPRRVSGGTATTTQKQAGKRLLAGYSRKRLMGFEPTTFCMASRRSSQLSYSRTGAMIATGVAPLGGRRGGAVLRHRSSSGLKTRPKHGFLPRMPTLLTIGEVSRRRGVAASALRFYEERGLITSERAGSRHRRYPRPVLRRIAFIVFAQRIGLTLGEIGVGAREASSRRAPNTRDWSRLSSRRTSRLSISGLPSSSG